VALSLQQLMELKRRIAGHKMPSGVAPGAYGYDEGGQVQKDDDNSKKTLGQIIGYPGANDDAKKAKGYSDGEDVTNEDGTVYSKGPEVTAEEAKRNAQKSLGIDHIPVQYGSSNVDVAAARKKGQEETAEEHKGETPAPANCDKPADEMSVGEAQACMHCGGKVKGYAEGEEVTPDDEDADEATAEETEAAAPAAAEEAPLSTSLAEALAAKDPDAVAKLAKAARASEIEAPYDTEEQMQSEGKAFRKGSKAWKKDQYDKALQQKEAQEAEEAKNALEEKTPAAEAAESEGTSAAEKAAGAADEAIPLEKSLVPVGERGLVPAGKTAAAAAEEAAPVAAEEVGERGLVPLGERALATIGGEGAGLALRDLAGPAALLMPNDAMADTSQSKLIPIPSMPGKYMRGQDIVGGPAAAALYARQLAGGKTPPEYGPPTSLMTPPASAEEYGPPTSLMTPPPAAAVAPKTPVPAAPTAPIPPAQPSTAIPAPSQNPLQALMDKLGIGSATNDKLARAQQAQQQIMLGNALNMAGKEIGAGFARGRGSKYEPDYTSNQAIGAMAGLPVQNIRQQQAIVKDALDSGMKASDLLDKQQMRAPDSPVSAAYRSMAIQWNPALKDIPNFDQMDAEGIKALLPGEDTKLRAAVMEQTAQQREADRQQTMALRQQDQQSRMSAQRSQQQDNAEMRLGTALTQMNSLRGANGQAQKNSQLADRITDLANSYNANDPQSVANSRLILNETMGMLAQAANGGIAHEGQVERIYPNNLGNEFSKLQSFITSAPAGYDIQPYIDQAVQQAKIFKQVGQNYEKKNNAMLLYGAKNAVRPEVYDHYKTQLGLEDSDLNNAYSRVEDTTSAAKKVDNASTVLMRDPQGNTRSVRKDQVQDALKAGGRLLQ